MTERVGFIGLGVMGKPMVRNLIAGGYGVVAYDRHPEKVAEAVAAGAEAAVSCEDVAARSDVVITMLTDSASVSEVALGADGVLAKLRPGALLIDMSTIHPSVSRHLAEAGRARGVAVLDAPVSGGDVGAQQGTLSIMVGGAEADFARAQPILSTLGSTIVHVGPSGAGQVVKACNQIVVALAYAAISEALVLGSKAGIKPALILDVLSGGMAANRIMEARRRNLLEHEFTPGFKVDLHHKDLAIALDTGDEIGVPLSLTALVQQMFCVLRTRGLGGLDHSALLTLVEDLSAHKIGEDTVVAASAAPAPVPTPT